MDRLTAAHLEEGGRKLNVGRGGVCHEGEKTEPMRTAGFIVGVFLKVKASSYCNCDLQRWWGRAGGGGGAALEG